MLLRRFASFWIYPVLAALLWWLISLSEHPAWAHLGWLIPAGFLIWTLIEYVLHRFIFHWEPQSKALIALWDRLHFSHHVHPRDPDKLLVRPLFSLPVSALVFAILYLASGSLFAVAGVMIGIWTGFLYYESVHYRLHLTKSGRGLLKHQRRWHFRHHFVDPDHCFGVTSPVWDLIFRTYRS